MKISAPISVPMTDTICRFPHLEVMSNEIIHLIKDLPPLVCDNESDWIIVNNGNLVFNLQILLKYTRIVCDINFIERADDFSNGKGKYLKYDSSVNINPIKLSHDFFTADCVATDANDKTKKWHNLMMGIHRVDKWKNVNKTLNDGKLNVLMFGFDSLSHMHLMRKMPKAYDYLTKELNAIVLNGYNIVGDGTPQALIPILTGKAEPELPETRRRMKNSVTCDVYPFIWNNFSDNGYVTAWIEDGQWVGTFQYRLNGFKDEPTDHYGRPFYLQFNKESKKHKPYCLRSQKRHSVMMNWVSEVFKVYNNTLEPKFAFGFHSEYSHDSINDIQYLDEDFKQWLKGIHDDGILNSTIMIVMSDHGARFSALRGTQQGKLEERMPFFSFILPEWFERRFPNAYKNLKLNANKLTAPFDLHATFMTIIQQLNKGLDTTDELKCLNNLPRSLSLFSYIPTKRSCSHAGIEPHWCTCLQWTNVSNDDPIVVRAANDGVKFINNLTSLVRNFCVPLTLLNITNAVMFKPMNDLMAYKKNSDADGFVADLSDKTKVTTIVYQLQLHTLPNFGIYEISMVYSAKTDSFIIKDSDISRINKYGDQPKCVQDNYPHLRMYCYCK